MAGGSRVGPLGSLAGVRNAQPPDELRSQQPAISSSSTWYHCIQRYQFLLSRPVPPPPSHSITMVSRHSLLPPAARPAGRDETRRKREANPRAGDGGWDGAIGIQTGKWLGHRRGNWSHCEAQVKVYQGWEHARARRWQAVKRFEEPASCQVMSVRYCAHAPLPARRRKRSRRRRDGSGRLAVAARAAGAVAAAMPDGSARSVAATHRQAKGWTCRQLGGSGRG